MDLPDARGFLERGPRRGEVEHRQALVGQDAVERKAALQREPSSLLIDRDMNAFEGPAMTMECLESRSGIQLAQLDGADMPRQGLNEP